MQYCNAPVPLLYAFGIFFVLSPKVVMVVVGGVLVATMWPIIVKITATSLSSGYGRFGGISITGIVLQMVASDNSGAKLTILDDVQ